MKPSYDEKVEIIPNKDGTLVCSIAWNGLTFAEDLPKGADRWQRKQFKGYLQTVVIPKLRIQLLKAQKAALDDGSAPVEACMPAIELSAQDIARMKAAEKKRAMRTAKRKQNLN